uniref:Uncharacterized protein n=1 Tax=Megaselia scalaris TaxID=36166 RepID=T1GY27_MEGSC
MCKPVIDASLFIDPVKVGGNSGEDTWETNFTSEGNTEGGQTNQDWFAIFMNSEWATGISIACGFVGVLGSDTDVGRLNISQTFLSLMYPRKRYHLRR